MCKCGKRTEIVSTPGPIAIPGEAGFVYLKYIGQDAKTEYGSITGSRYPFLEAAVRLVDRRDAEVFIKSGSFQVVG